MLSQFSFVRKSFNNETTVIQHSHQIVSHLQKKNLKIYTIVFVFNVLK